MAWLRGDGHVQISGKSFSDPTQSPLFLPLVYGLEFFLILSFCADPNSPDYGGL